MAFQLGQKMIKTR